MIKNKIGYKLSFEESSNATIQNVLSDVRNICQLEIQNQFNKFFEMLDKYQPQLSLEEKKDILLDLSQFQQDQTLLEDIKLYQFKILKNFFQNYGFGICISKKLDEHEFLFENNIISNLIGYLRESYQEVDQNYIVETPNTQNKVWNKVVEISKEILKKYDLNQEENQIFEDICKQLVHFSKYEDWNNLYVFFGNPLSGKSTAINLLCKIPQRSKLFDNVLMNLHHGVLPKGIYNLLEYGKNDQNLFIEFQSFSQQYLVLLQYFYTYCQKNNRRFSISIVLNADMTLQNEIQIALDEFIKLNQITDCNCLNFIVNLKEGTSCPEKIEINFNQQRIELQKNQYQKIFTIQSQFNEDFINISRLNFFQQNQTRLTPQQFINLSYLFQKNLDYLIQAFNSNCANLKTDYKFINDQNNEKNINLFLNLLTLNPKNENFEIVLYSIQESFGTFQISDLNQRNHQKLKKLFEILIENHQLFDKIKELSKFLQCFLKNIEDHNQNYSRIQEMNQTDIINFLNDALRINPNFFVEKDKKNLERLKLFYNQFFDSSIRLPSTSKFKICFRKLYNNFCSVINQSKVDVTANQQPSSNLNLFKEFNIFQTEVLHLINQLQKLMALIKQTQKKGYTSLDYWLIPLGLLHNRFAYHFSDEFENEQIKKQSDAVTVNIQNMSYIQDY